MQTGINISNIWKTTKNIYINISSSWKSCKNIYTKVSGSWKSIWSYSWKTGNWGSCTQSCGGGTQTRSVYCYRADGFTVNDSYCSGTKPSTSQSCNTHSCAVCAYDENKPTMGISIYEGSTLLSISMTWEGTSVTQTNNTSNSVSFNGYMYSLGTLKTSTGPSYGYYTYTYEVCRKLI